MNPGTRVRFKSHSIYARRTGTIAMILHDGIMVIDTDQQHSVITLTPDEHHLVRPIPSPS